MADPRILLAARLQTAVAAAFGSDAAGVEATVRRSERADYQADLAMGLAKALKRAPRQVAEAIVAKLDLDGDLRTRRDRRPRIHQPHSGSRVPRQGSGARSRATGGSACPSRSTATK